LADSLGLENRRWTPGWNRSTGKKGKAMRDHEDEIRERIIKEHGELQEELFRRKPLIYKIHAYIYSIAFVGFIFFGLWMVGYMIYVLIFKWRR